MTVQLPERVDPETISLEKFEFDVACDIYTLGREDFGYPRCPGDPARWVAWRSPPCGHGPSHRLICESCRQAYLNWEARGIYFECRVCGEDTGPYVAYTPLEGKS